MNLDRTGPRSLFWVLCALVLGACTPGPETNEDQRDPFGNPGKTLVYESMEIHGGRDHWYGAGLLKFRWRYLMQDVGPEAIVDTLQIIDPESLSVRHEVVDREIQFGWTAGKTWVLPKGALFSPPPKFWALTPFYFFGIPFVFDDPNARFELLPEVVAFDGNYFSQVKVTYTALAGDSPDDTYILLIDPVSKVTRGAIYTVTSPLVAPDGPIAPKLITLDDPEWVGGVLLAQGHRTFEINGGEIGKQIRATEVSEIEWIERGTVDMGIPGGAAVLE